MSHIRLSTTTIMWYVKKILFNWNCTSLEKQFATFVKNTKLDAQNVSFLDEATLIPDRWKFF